MSGKLTQMMDELRARIERLSAREVRMLGSLLGVAAMLLVFGTGYWITSGLGQIEERNESIRRALRRIERSSGRFMEQRSRMAALQGRMSHGAIELNSFVEKAATAVGVSIVESGEVSPLPGDSFVRKGIEVKVQRVTMSQLASLLKALEDDQAHIVQVTQLSVHTRWNRNQELDADLVISTYEKKAAGDDNEGRRGRGASDRGSEG